MSQVSPYSMGLGHPTFQVLDQVEHLKSGGRYYVFLTPDVTQLLDGTPVYVYGDMGAKTFYVRPATEMEQRFIRTDENWTDQPPVITRCLLESTREEMALELTGDETDPKVIVGPPDQVRGFKRV
jgi:hypothetical protein